MTSYKKEILTVIQDGFCIGYMARRHYIYGFSSEIETGWCVTDDIKKPAWRGNYKTRKDASEYLEWVSAYKNDIATKLKTKE